VGKAVIIGFEDSCYSDPGQDTRLANTDHIGFDNMVIVQK